MSNVITIPNGVDADLIKRIRNLPDSDMYVRDLGPLALRLPAFITTAEVKSLEAELTEMNDLFNSMHNAEMRGIKAWRAEKLDERKLRLPDTAGFVVYLLNKIEFNETVFDEMKERESALEQRLAVVTEALERLSRLGNGDILGNSDGNVIAQKALAESDRLAQMEAKDDEV